MGGAANVQRIMRVRAPVLLCVAGVEALFVVYLPWSTFSKILGLELRNYEPQFHFISILMLEVPLLFSDPAVRVI